MAEKYDVIVVGGGPGGYPAAIRAAQLGKTVALVEADKLGGECTNYGCIPTKAMIKPASLVYNALKLSFTRGEITVDYEAMMEWVRGIVERVSGGVSMLLRGYGVQVYKGRAVLASSTSVELDDGTVLRGDRIVVATGSVPARIPGLEPDGIVVHDNRSILGLKRKPGSMTIIGGGYIGVEYATLMAKLGVEVHLVELLDRLLPAMDKDFSRLIERRLKKLGVKVYTGTRVEGVERGEGLARVSLSNGQTLETDIVLVAVGRKPNTQGIGLERAGVKVDERGFIRVDERMMTSSPMVYASGDAAGQPMLAHKAFLQAVVAGENAAGGDAVYNPRAVPAVVYTEPELASTGMTLAEAREKGFNAVEKRYPIGGLAMASIEDATDGFIKIVYDADTGTVLGAHVAAPHASEIISELTLAVEMGAYVEDLALTIHPHPSISEAVKEAAEYILEKPIHYLLQRRKAK